MIVFAPLAELACTISHIESTLFLARTDGETLGVVNSRKNFFDLCSRVIKPARGTKFADPKLHEVSTWFFSWAAWIRSGRFCRLPRLETAHVLLLGKVLRHSIPRKRMVILASGTKFAYTILQVISTRLLTRTMRKLHRHFGLRHPHPRLRHPHPRHSHPHYCHLLHSWLHLHARMSHRRRNIRKLMF